MFNLTKPLIYTRYYQQNNLEIVSKTIEEVLNKVKKVKKLLAMLSLKIIIHVSVYSV
jgi:hypothetical protein